MSYGNKFDVITHGQHGRLPFEQMGNVLLDAMQGTLVCLDHHHIIVDVSKTVKRNFGFEQMELVGLPILLLIEDSERDAFLKFLNSPPQPDDVCCVRMMMNNTNEYRQVKVHRKKKSNRDTVDVHSTTPRHSSSIDTILVLLIDESSYIDITLHDIHKDEFYTKMNLIGEIIFEDHRGALITGFLPNEILSQSIFNFVYQEDRLVKLHALWKCVTTGASKLQWRLNARDGSLVFLQTEYKLVAEHQNQDIIVARNEILSPVQRSQFDELQTAWRHQCTADIKGNSASFKLIAPSESDSSYVVNGECRICVPSLNMCFTTNKLQPLNLTGNIFEGTKLARPLTIQDYIHILIDNDKHIDSELAAIISNIQSLTARYRRSNETDKGQSNPSDMPTDEQRSQAESLPSASPESSLRRKQDSDSIVRGILSNSAQYNNQQKQSGESPSTLTRLLNGNATGNSAERQDVAPPRPVTQAPQAMPSPGGQTKFNTVPISPEMIHQQHIDFIKKYNAAKAKLESQLEVIRSQDGTNNGSPSDVSKRSNVLSRLAQLEAIKNKHLARRHDIKRQLQASSAAAPVDTGDQKDFLSSFFSSSSPNSLSFPSMDTNGGTASMPSPVSTLFSSPTDPSSFYPNQRSSSQPFDSGPHAHLKTPLFEDFLTPPSSSSSFPSLVNHSSSSVHAYMNVSFQGTTSGDSNASSSFNHQHQHHHQHHTNYPF